MNPALKEEPLITPKFLKAMKTSDTGFDPYRLTLSRAMDAVNNGAVIKNYHETIEVLRSKNMVYGVKVFDKLKGKVEEFHGSLGVSFLCRQAHTVTTLILDIPKVSISRVKQNSKR